MQCMDVGGCDVRLTSSSSRFMGLSFRRVASHFLASVFFAEGIVHLAEVEHAGYRPVTGI